MIESVLYEKIGLRPYESRPRFPTHGRGTGKTTQILFDALVHVVHRLEIQSGDVVVYLLAATHHIAAHTMKRPFESWLTRLEAVRRVSIIPLGYDEATRMGSPRGHVPERVLMVVDHTYREELQHRLRRLKEQMAEAKEWSDLLEER